jgi:PAS domain S-box-containing protein
MALPNDLRIASFENVRLPIVLLDMRGVPALWNPAFAELFTTLTGHAPERLTGSFFEFLSSRGGARLDYYAAEVLIGGRDSALVETTVTAIDGGRRWLSLILSSLRPAGGAVNDAQCESFILCTIEDVTERVLREDALRTAKEEAERATHTKSLFLANMSHEIRTPIQTILGVVELLRETRLDTEQTDYVERVGFSADVLLGLINDILDFSKIEAGRIDLETGNFELRACIYQAVDLLAIEADRKGLELVVDIDDRLPLTARGDERRLRQVLVNLLKNAVKFTHEGSVSLHAVLSDSPAGRNMRFEVVDTGPGIPDDVRDKLFTPFFQAETQNAGKSGGTGLGLAISRSLVEAMGGRIGADAPPPRRASVPGGPGVVFWFELPLASPDFSAPPRPEAAPQGARLLVVDDHELARDFAAAVAAKAGYEVRTSSSGEAALAELRRAAREGSPFSLCLIDQTMPHMDGWRLASEITGDTSINAVRLILMTGAAAIGPDVKMKLLRWFNGYIAKPLRPPQLLEALAYALSENVDLEGADYEREKTSDAENFDATVLLAEDHDVNRELFVLMLTRMGCKVTAARDGLEAVKLTSQKPFDLVLMDIFMPRMSGYEASRAMRAAGYKGPIIAVTAGALKDERSKCLEAGMDGILVKPFKKQDLARALEAALKGKLRGESAAETPPAAAPADIQKTTAAEWADIFDWDGVLDTFLGQKETVLSLLGRFIAKAEGQLTGLAEALESRDLQRFREISHSLKGASWNLSARRLGDAALSGETAGRNGDAEAAAWSLGEIRSAFMEFTAAAAPYLQGAEHDPPRAH